METGCATMRAAGLWYVNRQRAQSVLEPSSGLFSWNGVIISIVAVILYLLTAYLLARWLYPVAALPAASDSDA